MDLIAYILLGVIQGIFEWLPISSQGISVVILTNMFNVAAQTAIDMSIFLHIGTLLAAILYFWKDIKELIIKTKYNDILRFNKNLRFDYTTNISRFILISVFFTLLIGVPIYFLVKHNINAYQVSVLTVVIGIFLLITGLLQVKINKAKETIPKFSNSDAFFVGGAQGLSVIPGISRSGITTSMLLFQGHNPENAFKYSFLISIPTILIAECGILILNGFTFSPLILVSIVFAFIFGYLTIDILMKISKHIDFTYFCFILGIAYILIGLL
ncbi:MAG: undecaprenyl-diphosphate phosphatase [archaeon]